MEHSASMLTGIVGLALVVLALIVAAFWVIFPVMVYLQIKETNKLLRQIGQEMFEAKHDARRRDGENQT